MQKVKGVLLLATAINLAVLIYSLDLAEFRWSTYVRITCATLTPYLGLHRA